MPPMTDNEPLWTLVDVAGYLGVGESTVKRIRQSDPTFPPAHRLATRVVRWTPSEVRAWADGQREGSRQSTRRGRPAKPVTV